MQEFWEQWHYRHDLEDANWMQLSSRARYTLARKGFAGLIELLDDYGWVSCGFYNPQPDEKRKQICYFIPSREFIKNKIESGECVKNRDGMGEITFKEITKWSKAVLPNLGNLRYTEIICPRCKGTGKARKRIYATD